MLDDLGDFPPRRFADRLEGLPAFADHDLALALALHIDRLLDPDIAAPQFLPRFGLDRGMVGQFLVQPLEQLLARDLGRQLAHRRIRHLIGRIKPRTWRHAVGEPGLEIGHAVAGERRDHEGRIELGLFIGDLGQQQQRGARHQIDLVEDQDFRRLHVGKPIEQSFRLFVDPLARIDQHADQIGLVRTAPGRRHHGAVEPPLRSENSRRVDEDKLRVAL